MSKIDSPLLFYFEHPSGIGIFRYMDPLHEMEEEDLYRVIEAQLSHCRFDELEQGGFGYLPTKETLHKFAFHLCQKLKRSKIGLISSSQFNDGLSRSFTQDEFKELLFEKADYINNPEVQTSKNFIKNLFKP